MFTIRNGCYNISTLSPENSKKILGKIVVEDRCELILEWMNVLTQTFASKRRTIFNRMFISFKISVLFLGKEKLIVFCLNFEVRYLHRLVAN